MIETAVQKIDLKTEAGLCDATIARPKAAGRYPGVVMLMDAFGPRTYLVEMATKLASEGYVVLLPNLFYRSKRAPLVDAKFPLAKEEFAATIAQVLPLARAYDPQDAMKDVAAFVGFLKKQDDVGGKIGLTGYCMGGGIALRAAATLKDQISAVASFHAGRLATDAPESPHRLLGAVTAEVYVAHADNDESMPPEQIERFKKALEESNTKFEAETYTGANHGFTMADLPAGNAQAIERHWQKLRALFSRDLKV